MSVLGPNERVARHENGHLIIERLPLPTQADFDEKFKSLAKAWPVLADHASHIDGEFDNALTDVRRMVERLLEALAAPSETRGQGAATNGSPSPMTPVTLAPSTETGGVK